jgi:hypothetical protein
MRLVFYLFAVASDDERTQKKGFILILFNVGPNKVGDPHAATLIPPLIETMAVKVSSVHYCYEPAELMAQTMSAFMKNTDSQTRARFRIHCGAFIISKVATNRSAVPSLLLYEASLCMFLYSTAMRRFRILTFCEREPCTYLQLQATAKNCTTNS